MSAAAEQTRKERAMDEDIRVVEAELGDHVVVQNRAHDDPADHEYRVDVTDTGVPYACECPDYEYRDAFCKHQHAALVTLNAAAAARR